jgi:hypothetical protein
MSAGTSTLPLPHGPVLDPARSDHEATVDAFLRRAVLVAIFAQRFALPGGGSLQVPLTQVLLLVLLVEGVSRGVLVFRTRLLLTYLGLVAFLVGVTLLHSVLGFDIHPTSVGYLVVLYLPMACKLNVARPRESFERMVGFYVRMMTWVSLAGLLLFVAQFGGIAYKDWFGVLVPASFVQQGYITSYGLTFGSDIFRNNCVVFLEASFYSGFVAVAFLGALLLREKPWRLALFGLCLVSTVSGTGVVVVLIATLVLAVGGSIGTIIRALVPMAAVLLIGATTPVGAALLERLTEGSRGNSSTSLRMVVPYQIFLPKVMDSGPLVWIGHGAGSTDDAVQMRDLIYPLVPKAMYDYGIPFTLVFLAFAFAAMGSNYAWPPITFGLVAIWVYVGAGLLATTQVAMMLLFAAWWPTTDDTNEADGEPPDVPERLREPVDSRLSEDSS